MVHPQHTPPGFAVSTETNVDLLASGAWPPPRPTTSRAVQELRAGPSINEVALHLDGLRSPRLPVAVLEALEAAADTLGDCDAGDPLHAPSHEAALRALEALQRALDSGLDRRSASDPAAALTAALRTPGGVAGDVSRAMVKFVADSVQAHLTSRSATFSLILLRAEDHEGAALRSLRSDPRGWRYAIRPPVGVVDHHLALIPPAHAAGAVDGLAAGLGLSRDRLPCVVFLGDELTLERRRDLSVKWACNPLEGPDYVASLTRIYEVMYAAPGWLARSSAGAAMTQVTARISWLTVVKLLAGVLGGSSLVKVLEAFAGSP